MREHLGFAALCFVSLTAMGCTKETTSSANIKTGGIAALIDVYADTDTTAKVHVKLVVGGADSNTYVDLEGNDRLTATAAGKTKTLTVVDTGIYEASFSGVGEDTEFAVTLDRPDDETASDNSGKLPAPYTLAAPPDDMSRKNDDLDITWDPASHDSMVLEFDGDCIFHKEQGVPDEGSYTLRKGSLDSTGDSDHPETCDVSLNADRTRKGSADSKFDPDSYFVLHQRRATHFASKP